jgi:hypothetical protein
MIQYSLRHIQKSRALMRGFFMHALTDEPPATAASDHASGSASHPDSFTSSAGEIPGNPPTKDTDRLPG